MIYILNILTCLISIYFVYFLGLFKFQIKKFLIISISVLSLMMLFLIFQDNLNYISCILDTRFILSIGLIAAFSIAYYKEKVKYLEKSLFSVFILFIVNSFAVNLVKIIFISVFNYDKLIYDVYFMPISTLVSYIYTIVMIFLIKKYSKLNNYNIKDIFKNSFLYYSIISLFSFALIIDRFTAYTISIIAFNKIIFNALLILNEVTIVIFFGITLAFIYLSKRHEEILFRQLELEKLTEYTNNIEVLNEDIRAFKHDFVNILSCIRGYLDTDNFGGLKSFFLDKILPLNNNLNKHSLRLNLLSNIKTPEIKGLISSKVLKAKSEGIDIFIDISDPIEDIKMDTIDLCRILGILLDNAIEAAVLCTNPILKLGIIKKQRSISFIVINSFEGETPKIHEIYVRGFSTKGTGRGIGLANLKSILSNYYNTILDTSIEDNLFIQNIEIINRRINL
ncbi:sensor histidine kinase-like protein [Clostridium scatologenes]|uniref:Sensor histidine kinase-like protein n=2 Tax=Clostridium scatologenes TaxID=1548 RepID=A0A0E3JNH6_CLOSL|nr:sensor histidine kinase-like protein [Clostridium scatologenes]